MLYEVSERIRQSE